MDVIIVSLTSLGAVGAFSAVILFFVAKKFYVYEDPRVDEVEALLPSANCGGCGYPGCRGFAAACVKADDLGTLFCPVGGMAVMEAIGNSLGKTAAAADPTVAVLLCNGTCSKRPRTNEYNGARNCGIAHSLYGGETNCSYGCLGMGDCQVACKFDALYIDSETGLPEINEEKCTSCGACVKACPRQLIELRRRGPKSRRVYVACRNKDKGAMAKKACGAACIGCSKCAKTCKFEAITVVDSLAYIDSQKCRLCRKCASECPTEAIVEINFPPRKEAMTEQAG